MAGFAPTLGDLSERQGAPGAAFLDVGWTLLGLYAGPRIPRPRR